MASYTTGLQASYCAVLLRVISSRSPPIWQQGLSSLPGAKNYMSSEGYQL